MKTTIQLPDDLYRKAKSRAALENKTMKVFIAEAIERRLHLKHESNSALDAETHWLDDLPKLPEEAVQDLEKIINSPDFRAVEKPMWE